MRPAGAAVEPGGNPCPLERVLDESLVVLRGPDEDRHLVKGDSAARLDEDATGDLDALPSFAWRREELQRAIERTGRRGVVGKEIGAEALEVRAACFVDPFVRPAGPLQGVDRRAIVQRHRGEYFGRCRRQRSDERLL